MLHIEIPGRALLKAKHVALDYNGTIAVDGVIAPEVAERLRALAGMAHVCVLTADTYGTARAQCEPLGLEVRTFPQGDAAPCKRAIVEGLSGGVIAFGNGFNDAAMFDAAVLSVAVVEGEGAWAGLIAHADVLVRNTAEGLDLLLKPNRLKATLRG